MSISLRVSRSVAFAHLSVADQPGDGWRLQVASARRHGSDVFLNLIQVPTPFRFSMKMERLLEIVPKLPAQTLVVMIDALDVLFNHSMHHLVASFQQEVGRLGRDKFGRLTSIMCNGERNCWPDPSWASRFPEETLRKPLPFLNSGVLLGSREAVGAVLQRFPWIAKTDDQAYWMNAYLESLENPELPRIEIDHFGILACCFFRQPLADLACRNGVIYYREQGTRPCLLHFNGPTKKIMPQIASQIGVNLA